MRLQNCFFTRLFHVTTTMHVVSLGKGKNSKKNDFLCLDIMKSTKKKKMLTKLIIYIYNVNKNYFLIFGYYGKR